MPDHGLIWILLVNATMTDSKVQTSTEQRFLRLPLHISERRLILIGLDLLAMNGALLLALALRLEYSLDWRLLIQRPRWFVLLSVLWLPLAYAFDAYDLRVAGRLSTAALAVLKAGLLTALFYLLIPFVTPSLPTRRLAVVTFPLLAITLLLAGRGLYALALAQPFFQRRVLIIGAGWAGRTITQALAKHSDGTFHVMGFVDDDPVKQGTAVEIGECKGEGGEGKMKVGATGSSAPQQLSSPAPRFPGPSAPLYVLGDCHALKDLITTHRVTTLILAITRDVNGELLQILMDSLELGVEIIPMPVLYERLTGRVPVQHVGGNWYVAMPIHHPATGALWPLVKRGMDIVLANLGLICLGLVTPFIAAAIYLDSPGPIFYGQWRVGKGGRHFRAYKFRSMMPDAEKGRAVWAEADDHRVTRVGRILRRTHVDEFPQFLNILKGEMSAVGPRPERPEFVEELAAEIPFYRVRHAVKPGMAGWGLVKQGYGASKEDTLLKLQYDLYYIKHQSLWLDIVILLKTIVDTLTLRGR
jgi:lipopolysaccharide/colanic/teichoic acid biosynthesis glycosyltransferase